MYRVLAAVLLLSMTLAASGFKERYSANLVRMYGPSRTRTTMLTIGIDELTSDEELKTLHDLLGKEGPDAVKKHLWSVEKGALFTTNSLAVPLCFVRVEDKPGGKGRRIIGISARRIAFRETWHQTRSLEYPWSVVVLDLDANGRGTGQLMEAAKIEMADSGKVEVTYNTIQPARLQNVRRSGK